MYISSLIFHIKIGITDWVLWVATANIWLDKNIIKQKLDSFKFLVTDVWHMAASVKETGVARVNHPTLVKGKQ